ncbi:MAG: hypothetical protein Q4B64_01815 [Spirochaetales bacterium]|nr:hypothetical protein [Spirochaetales bacterium]
MLKEIISIVAFILVLSAITGTVVSVQEIVLRQSEAATKIIEIANEAG